MSFGFFDCNFFSLSAWVNTVIVIEANSYCSVDRWLWSVESWLNRQQWCEASNRYLDLVINNKADHRLKRLYGSVNAVNGVNDARVRAVIEAHLWLRTATRLTARRTYSMLAFSRFHCLSAFVWICLHCYQSIDLWLRLWVNDQLCCDSWLSWVMIVMRMYWVLRHRLTDCRTDGQRWLTSDSTPMTERDSSGEPTPVPQNKPPTKLLATHHLSSCAEKFFQV